jgi:hypothetical protein
MKKARFFILLTLVVLFLFGSMIRPTQEVKAVSAAFGYEKYYTVWYTCIIGPQYPGPVGEWYVDCSGNWSGYGWKPFEHPECSDFDLTYGEQCFPE